MDFVRRLGNSIKQLCGGREGNAGTGRGGKAKAKVTQTKTPKEQREGRQKKKNSRGYDTPHSQTDPGRPDRVHANQKLKIKQ